jgi:hypothetical protein
VQAADAGTENLRRLAEVRLGRSLVLSLHLDLDPAEFATPPARATAARSLIDEADRRVRERDGLSHGDKTALKANLKRAREYLERDLEADGARAVAVFAAESAGLFETLKLPRSVRNRVAIARREAWCVILVNRQEGRVFRGSPHGLRAVGSVHDDVHGRHDQGGWSQARYQRSVDKEAADHLRHAAEVLLRHFQRRPFRAPAAGRHRRGRVGVRIEAPRLPARARGRVHRRGRGALDRGGGPRGGAAAVRGAPEGPGGRGSRARSGADASRGRPG